MRKKGKREKGKKNKKEDKSALYASTADNTMTICKKNKKAKKVYEEIPILQMRRSKTTKIKLMKNQKGIRHEVINRVRDD